MIEVWFWMYRSSQQIERSATSAVAHTAGMNLLLSQLSGDLSAANAFKEGGIRMTNKSILYISDHAPRSGSIIAALETTGYDVVSTDGSTQAIALLFVMHSVSAVVIDQHSIGQSSFDLPHSLRALRPDVPIVLLCADHIDRLPATVNYCVNTGQPLGKYYFRLGAHIGEQARCIEPG
jgi:CheY-like chemotaxis protein